MGIRKEGLRMNEKDHWPEAGTTKLRADIYQLPAASCDLIVER